MCLSHGIFGKPAPPEPATTRQPCPPDSLQTASDSSKSSQESFPSSMPTWSQINLLPAAGPCSYRTVATEAVGCRLPILRKEVLTLRACSPVETCSISPETPDALHPPVRRAGYVIAGCSNLCGCSWSGTCRLIIFIAARNLLALQQGEHGHLPSTDVHPERTAFRPLPMLRITPLGSVCVPKNLAHCFGTEIKKENPKHLKFFAIPRLISFPLQKT